MSFIANNEANGRVAISQLFNYSSKSLISDDQDLVVPTIDELLKSNLFAITCKDTDSVAPDPFVKFLSPILDERDWTDNHSLSNHGTTSCIWV